MDLFTELWPFSHKLQVENHTLYKTASTPIGDGHILKAFQWMFFKTVISPLLIIHSHFFLTFFSKTARWISTKVYRNLLYNEEMCIYYPKGVKQSYGLIAICFIRKHLSLCETSKLILNQGAVLGYSSSSVIVLVVTTEHSMSQHDQEMTTH